MKKLIALITLVSTLITGAAEFRLTMLARNKLIFTNSTLNNWRVQVEMSDGKGWRNHGGPWTAYAGKAVIVFTETNSPARFYRVKILN